MAKNLKKDIPYMKKKQQKEKSNYSRKFLLLLFDENY